MAQLVRRFRGFLVCAGVCAALFCLPYEPARLVAAIGAIFLAPSLFLLACVDWIRSADERHATGKALTPKERAALLPARGLVALFGLVTLVIGGAVCAWVLYLSHLGGLPVWISLFLGAIVLQRVFWARAALSYGGELVRLATGRERAADPFPDPTWGRPRVFLGSLELPPHGSVPLSMPGTRGTPDPEAVTLADALAARYPSLRREVEARLFEHLRSLGEQAPEGGSLPRLAAPDQVWSCVSLDHVCIGREGGPAPIELVMEPAWDEDCELRLRILDWGHLELVHEPVPQPPAHLRVSRL